MRCSATSRWCWITTSIVEPKLGSYDPSRASVSLSEQKLEPLDRDEKRALMWAILAAALVAVLIALTVVPSWGPLRNPETGGVANSPFLRGIVARGLGLR